MPKKKKQNAPKRLRKKSITLHNMKSVTVTRKSDGSVHVKGTRGKPKRKR